MQPMAGPAAALQRQPEPVQVRHLEPVTLPNALKGERPLDVEDEPSGDDPYIGTTIGDRYVIDDILGEGGMGKVYLAHHKVIDKKQAIKILHAELVKDKEAVGRFVREAKAASSIGNPHIVDISDFGETSDGSTYFVMEYLDGFTLGDLLEERHALPVDLIVDIALQLTDGLAAAHAQEIVHRDLKPENVTMIRRGQQAHFCKILDFGIAKVSTRVTTEKLTMAGAVFGTPHYMSPEQAAGAAVDLRTDIYSLGVMLYEMASGELPFNADNFMGILTQHMYKAPVPIRALVSAPDCPPGLEAVILKCLSKKPEARYQTMGELAEDLQRLSAGQIPGAVHEMMARSGSFNVPADYFKKGDAIVPATPDAPQPRRFGPRLAGIIAAVVCVVIALLVLFRDSLSTAETQPVASAGADASAAPAVGTSLQPVPTADEAAQRHVLIATEPVEATTKVDGIRIETPASVPVPVGQTVAVEVELDGYEPQRVVLDGSEKRKTIKLDEKKRSGAPRIIRRPTTPNPKSGTTQPKSGSSEVVDPWASKK
ncbi:MAG: serine/threonine protein kinase [Deltaproteobacteria bacterium]|nr:serine/threonine protein kinase [Deltaproteobacteria bacterium]MBW2534135.1 serine/threonine protein kinase [Deltaproteobacteria bacterium]